MSMPINRTFIIPVWMLVFGLLALFWAPLTAVTTVLLFVGAVMAPSIMLVVWRERALAVAEARR